MQWADCRQSAVATKLGIVRIKRRLRQYKLGKARP
jgi:hypothetical protein